jgi:ADP-heptose:LPS heptosyltransferase
MGNSKTKKMKILIAQTGKIGDMVLTTPMFRLIKEIYPDSILHVLDSKRNHQIIENHKDIDAIFTFKKNLFHQIYLIFKLRKEKYDYWIDPKDHFSRESMVFAKYSNARNKIGFNKKAGYFNYNIPGQEENYNCHVIDRNLYALKYLSISYEGKKRPVLFPDEKIYPKITKYFKKNTQKNVLVNISAGNETRLWSIDKWVEVINHITGSNFNLILSCVIKDKIRAEKIIEKTSGIILFLSDNIKELEYIISLSDLVISPDTSIIHIASAFNKPIIGLYPDEEWNYIKYAPTSDLFRVLKAKTKDDLSSIQSADVINSFKEISDLF